MRSFCPTKLLEARMLAPVIAIITAFASNANADTITQSFLYSKGVITTITAPPVPGTESDVTYAAGITPNGSAIYGGQTVQFTNSKIPVSFNFVDTSGVFTQINFPGAIQTYIGSVSISGHVVGGYVTSDQTQHAYLYDGSVFATLNVPFCPPATCQSAFANGINSTGEIVGSYTNGHAAPSFGFVDVNGVFASVTAPGAIDTFLGRVNDQGEIIGSSLITLDPNRYQGFIYDAGVFTPLSFPGAVETLPLGINNSGTIVGGYFLTLGGSESGFIYSNGTYQTFDLPGTDSTVLTGIDDQGDLVGYAFTTTPVPEPNSLMLLATGLSFMTGLGRRLLKNPRGPWRQLTGSFRLGRLLSRPGVSHIST